MFQRIVTLAVLAIASQSVHARIDNWAQWLLMTAEQHPSIQAVKHDLSAAGFNASALSMPLYNPSLDTSVEREGDEVNFQVGLSTSIDWHNVRSAQSALGKLQQQQSELAYRIATNDVLTQIVTAQINVLFARESYDLAKLHVEQNLQLLALARKQLDAGEVSYTDLAIAKSVVAQGIVVENEHLNAWLDAQQKVSALVDGDVSHYAISPAFWRAEINLPSAEQLMLLPVIQQLRLDWLIAAQAADVQRVANKPVPNIGLGLGQMAGEPLMSVNVSVPLQWRNDYGNASQAALERALASEQRLKAALLTTRESVAMRVKQLRQTQLRYEQWQRLHGNEMSVQLTVLRQRYEQGDLALADYQEQVQDLWAGMQAALTIEQNYRLAYIAYLHTNAALAAHVSSLVKSES